MKVFAAKFILIFGFIALLSFVFKFPADQAIASCVLFNASININYYPKDASGNQKNVFAGCNGDDGGALCTGEIKEFSGGSASLTKCSCYDWLPNHGCLQLLMSSRTPSLVDDPHNGHWHEVPSGLTPEDSGCSVSCTGNCYCHVNGSAVYTPTYTITCPVNGACGTGHWNCSAGDGVDPSSESGNPTDGYSWVCKGSDGGSPSGTCTEGPSCSGNPDAPTVTPPTESVCPASAPTGISWNDTAGPGGHYSIRIRDNANDPNKGLWEDSPPDCKKDVVDNTNGNACSDSVDGLSFSHTFHTGHAYSIWMYAINSCNHWSAQGGAWYNVITPINGGLGSCPACGGGTKSCNNPAPNECGLTCQQQGLDSSCNTPPCAPTGLSASSVCAAVGQANMTFHWDAAAAATSYTLGYYDSGGNLHQQTINSTGATSYSYTATVEDNTDISWYVIAQNAYGNAKSTKSTTSVTCNAPVLTVKINPAIGSTTGPDSVVLHSNNNLLGDCTNTTQDLSISTTTSTCTGNSTGTPIGSSNITPKSVSPACVFLNFTCDPGNGSLSCSGSGDSSKATPYLTYNQHATVTANYDCHYKVKAHVFVDFNGDQLQNKVGDPGYTGTIDEPDYHPSADYDVSNDIAYWGATGGSSGNPSYGTTNELDTTVTPNQYIYEITNIPPGTNNETVKVEVPTGWHLTTPPQQSVQFGGPQDLEGFVNFGIQPPAPTCTITASTDPVTNPVTVSTQSPHNKATLTTVATEPPTYKGNLTYTWAPAGDVLGSITSTNPVTTTNTTATAVWTAPSDVWDSDLTARPTATVCQTGASLELCNSCQVGVGTPPIVVKPYYSISGLVYVDGNKDTKQDDGEKNYTIPPYPTPDPADHSTKALTVSICPTDHTNTSTQFCTDNSGTGTAINVDPVTGTFDTGATPNLLSGEYNVKLMTLPDPSWSYSGGQNSYQITVHKPCPITDPIEPSGTCDPDKGNVSGVAFGINNLYTWIQTTGGDVYMKDGINYHVPRTVPDECKSTNPSESTTGYMSISNTSTIQMPGIMFTGNGTADFNQGSASLKQWVVGKGNTYTITLPQTTAYGTIEPYIKDTLKLSITTVGSCATPCALNTTTPGVYEIGSTSDNITVAETTFTTDHLGDFTFLIPGSLDITGNIKVPVGVVATFIVQGDIHVDKSVGEDYKSSASNIDGYFSTDKSFYIDGNGTNNCSSGGADKRLNMSGAIVTNANAPHGSGSFQLQRDMCGGDVCPTFSIQARPDFVINAPPYLQATNRIWQEVAP